MRAWMVGLSLVVLGLGLSPACKEEDETPPAPPLIDPVESPTGQAVITIGGSAEFGATVSATGATFSPAQVTADPYTARFYLQATLAENATSTLTFTATDAAGNVSEPTVVTVEQEHAHGQVAAITLELFVNGSATASPDDPLALTAGDELLAVAAAADAAGHALDVPVAITTDIPGAFVAGPMIANIFAAGEYRVAATVAGTTVTASRHLSVQPGPASEISLTATPAAAAAGARVRVLAEARDAFGNQVPGAAIALASTPALAASFTAPCGGAALEQGFASDGESFVAYDLSAVATAGYVFTLTADSGAAHAEAQVTIRPAAAARFAPLDPADCAAGEAFRFTDSTWSTDLAGPVSVGAGETVYYRYQVIDAYGNPTEGPVSAFTSAPGAQIIDDGVTGRGQIANLTVTGDYSLSAYIAGVAAPAVRSYSVGVADPQLVTLFLSATLAAPGDEVTAFATVKDRFGNVFPCPGDLSVMVIDASPAGAVAGPLQCNAGVYQRGFTFTANDTYAVTATHDGSVSASAYVTILGLDGTPPMVAIANVLVNGSPCVPGGTPLGCDVASGDQIDFQLVADDNISLSSVEYSAFFNSTGTLRTRRVLIAADAPLPVTEGFRFSIPGNALPEEVPLVGMAIDGAGNIATSDRFLLRVNVIAAGGRAVQVLASGQGLSSPMDLAFDAAGNLFVANDGNQDLQQIAAGSNVPFTWSPWNDASSYLGVDSAGNVYVTIGGDPTVYRVDATGASVTSYLTLTGGSAYAMSFDGATFAKGLVNVTSTTGGDGNTLTVGSIAFEFDTNGSCTDGAARRCLIITGGETPGEREALLAGAIETHSTSTSAVVTGDQVVLSARTAGEAGNSIGLVSNSGNITTSGAALREGHDEEFFLASSQGNSIYRFPLALAGNPDQAANHGAFNVGRTQRSLAVRDLSSAAAATLRDLVLYHATTGGGTLYASRAIDASVSQVFAVSNFDVITDLALEPATGCLLVATNGDGSLWTVDTRDPADGGPTVTRVASGFSDVRGLAFHDGGDLYVTDANWDAVLVISPSPDATDCF